MADYHDELLAAARRLIARRAGQRGPLPAAPIRRSTSTSYYALFHFLAGECAKMLVGTAPALVRRRRLLVRVITHGGMRLTFRKVVGTKAIDDVADFLRVQDSAEGPLAVPAFVRMMASTFLDAQDQRHRADYDLEKRFGVSDARDLIADVDDAIRAWKAASNPQDRQFKQGLCLLFTLRGRLRADDA